MKLSRRMLLQLMSAVGGSAGFNFFGISAASANDAEWQHGLSLFGALKYPADFKHFDYVNPKAPKGGKVRLSSTGSFDSLNPYSFKGQRSSLIFWTQESLMTSSSDEASTEYGLIAEAARHPEDWSWVEFRLRQEARFHDGSPVTPEDVIWSLEALKKSHPQYAFYYKNVVKAEQTGDHQVLMQFSEKGNRELPHITGQLPVLSKNWWTGKKPDGTQRDIQATTLEAPLGSGPYKVLQVKPGESITVKRIDDYWGKDLPVQVGQNNFDEIEQIYFRDTTVAFEAFKGDQYDWRRENVAKIWSTGYDFPAVKRGDVVVEKITLKNAQGMQAFVFNTRRAKFSDPRVRLAFNYAFDFEWSNANLFHMQYKRTASYFANSELAATGLPAAEELAILEPLRGKIPEEVFTQEFANPVNAQPQDQRKNLRQAFDLLNAAGWKPGPDRMLVNDKGERFEVVFLIYASIFERIVLPYAERLKKLGISARVRTVDSAQYERQVQNFDYDVIVGGWGQSLSPGNEQREYWGSTAADRAGSQNTVGIKDAAIDQLVERVGVRQGQDRPGACHAGARPGVVVEPLCRADVAPALRAHGALEPVRPAGEPAGLQHRLPGNLVVGRGKGRQGEWIVMLRPLALGAWFVALIAVATAEPRHGLSAFGDLKYPADFQQFDYVNPDAPKGGRIVTIGTAGVVTFDSFNAYILKGDAAQGLGNLFDTLMVRASDEPDAVYGLVASTADLADDRMSVTFKLRPEAKFSDGSDLSAADVADSFRLLKEHGHPRIKIQIRDVESCAIIDDVTVKYTFTGNNVRDLPMTVATLPIFSKAYYEKHDFSKTTLEPPLGSGPYKIKEFDQGDFITYERRDDYWARDLPINRGRYNFGEIKLLYFRDRTAELEALKAGVLDLREEFTSKHWATEYELPSVKDGRLIKAVLPDETSSGAQGFFINMRRAKFKDPRTRRALGYAFDYEWTNANLFFNLYKRTGSFFENSVIRATGKPDDAELALLEPLKSDLPAETFAEAIEPPVSNGSGQDRNMLREANRLLSEAGWKRQGTQLVNGNGEVLSIEFLIFSPTFERIIAPYVRNLKLLGIEASIRQVEAAQYQERLKNFDYDITTQRFTMSETPGVELDAFFSSATADVIGSFNMSGLKSPAVDKLIEHVKQARSREDLTIAARALDRALRAHHIWVPHWYKAEHNVVHWNIFGQPETKPRFARGILDTWWIDADKAATIKRGP